MAQSETTNYLLGVQNLHRHSETKNVYKCIEGYKCKQLEEFRINCTPGSTWILPGLTPLAQGIAASFCPGIFGIRTTLEHTQFLEPDYKFLKWTPESGWQYPSLARKAFSLSVCGADVRLAWGGKGKEVAVLVLVGIENRKIVMGLWKVGRDSLLNRVSFLSGIGFSEVTAQALNALHKICLKIVHCLGCL